MRDVSYHRLSYSTIVYPANSNIIHYSLFIILFIFRRLYDKSSILIDTNRKEILDIHIQ